MKSAKIDALIEKVFSEIAKHTKVAIAFSGGVDSSVVAMIAKKACQKAVAVTSDSQLLAKEELDNAKKMACEIGIKHIIIKEDKLANTELVENGPDRCYSCKKALFSNIKKKAGKETVILDGSNHSEKSEHRPGMLAAKELDVLSPLANSEVSKEQVREIARSLGLSNWAKPSMACLASRIPYGTRITLENIRRVNSAENALRSLGLSNIRVRDYDGLARIELVPEEFGLALERKEKIVSKLKKLGYIHITLDLEGYNPGSMNRMIKREKTEIHGFPPN